MDVSNAVAQKLRQDRELLDLLKRSDPTAQINREVRLSLNRPEMPKGNVTEEARAAFTDRMSELVSQAQQGFAGIPGLTAWNLMQVIGYASVGGTAEGVVKALELACVKHGTSDDIATTRGPGVVG